MNSALHIMGRSMISGLMNFLSYMFKTGQTNLEIKWVKEFWETVLLITGLKLMTSKST